ncbi:MAG TPA: DUF362 domain-containing protein [Bacteroidota bacterium]|nr:DUF362 domain-containing protein [Bacteroidota bacterium]
MHKESEDSHHVNSSRRDFVKKVGATTAGLLIIPYLKPSGVLAYERTQGSSFVTAVALAGTKNLPADTYVVDDTTGGVKQRVKYILDLLDQNSSGGVASLFTKGKKVGIKINLTGGSGNAVNFKPTKNAKFPDYTITEAMWTHPAVIQAVGEYILAAGVNPADLYIVDSFWDTKWQQSGSTAPFGSNDSYGYKAVQTALGCNVVDLNDTTAANIVTMSTGSGHFNFPSFTMNKILQTIDVYVSIPKLKHHSAAGLTSSLKNQIGAVPQPLYTITNDNGRRGALHHPSSTASEWNYLPETICDLNAARPVHLAVIDAIKNSTGGEGSWCSTFAPCSKHALIAGLDPVAADSVAATIMGLDPGAKSFPLPAAITDGSATSSVTDNHLDLLHTKGVGTNQMSEIEILGDSSVLTERPATVSAQPAGFQLCSNFPNPFNPSTMIVFYMPRSEYVTLRVYDITGRMVEELISGEVPPGQHRLQWSAHGLASGVYLCRMQTKDFSETIKMIYQK